MSKPVERLFPFVLRAGILLVGRDVLARSKSKLQFLLIATDLSENSRKQILQEFAHYPIVQRYSSEQIEQFFKLKGTKVLGFAKTGLAKSIYAEVKEHRINKPGPASATDPAQAPVPQAPPENKDKPAQLSADEQMANFEEQLKEDDWGHQPC